MASPIPRLGAAPGRIARPDGGFADPPPALGISTAATITPDGGQITSDDGALTLRFPAGAVLEPVVVTVQRREVPAWRSVPDAFFWADFSATSVKTGRAVHAFAVPVSLALRVPDSALVRLRLRHGVRDAGHLQPEHLAELRWWQYDEAAGRWLPQPSGYDAASQTLHVRLAHFSPGAAGMDGSANPSTPPGMAAHATDLFTGWPSLAYPLPVPPGTAGMAPALELRYFGGIVDVTQHIPAPLPTAQAGWTGYGWQVEPGVIVPDTSDEGLFSLSLGGQSVMLRLNKAEQATPTACAAAEVEGCYHTDPERFAKIDHLWQAVAVAQEPASWISIADAGASGGSVKRSATAGDRVRFAFSGTNVTWYTTTGPDQGTAKVFIDGTLVKEESNYALSTSYQQAHTYSAPSSGSHELVIAVTGVRPAGSANAWVTVDAFDGGAGRVEESALAAGDWSAGWLADYWTVTAKDGTRYRFGYNLPAEVLTPPSPPPTGVRTTTGSLEWMLVNPTGSGTKPVRQGTKYHLDQVADPRGNQLTLTYEITVADVAGGYASTVLADVPSGYWRLNETSGTTAADSSGNGYSGTYVGTITNGIPGGPLAGDPQPVTQISSTNGDTGDYISMGNIFDAPSAFTLEAWVYKTGTSNYDHGDVVAKGNSGWTGYALAIKFGKAQLRIRDELFELYGTTTLALNTWYHVAATYDGTTARVYLNGVQEAAANPSVLPRSTGIPFQIGNGNANEDLEFIGRIAEAAFYPRALTAQQILSHYQVGTGSQAGAAGPTRSYARTAYLRQIDYTQNANAGITGQRRVLFDRTSRLIGDIKDYETDAEFDARQRASGSAIRSANSQRFFADQRLSGISTWVRPSSAAAWQEVARWDLDHSYLTTGTVGNTDEQYKNRLLLRSITPSNAGGTESLPATTFDYNAGNDAIISHVANGYGGEVTYAYEPYHPAENTEYDYLRVVTRTTTSGVTNYAGTAQATPAQHVTSYSYPSGSTLFDRMPGHPRVQESDGVGVIVHDFNANGDSTYLRRPGLRGTETQTTYRNPDGVTGVRVQTRTFQLKRLTPAADPPENERQVVQLDAEEEWSSEATTRQVRRTEYKLDDPYGNVTQIVELGDMAVPGDERTTTRTHLYATSGGAYLVDRLQSATLSLGTPDAPGAAVQEVRYSYDSQAYGVAPTRGLGTRVQRIDSQAPTNTEVTRYAYDAYGNQTKATRRAAPGSDDPASGTWTDAAADAVSTTTYDGTYQTFATGTSVRAADTSGGRGTKFLWLTTARTFDERSGNLLTVTDPNNAVTRYTYDTFGRLTEVRRPGDDTGQATITYDYSGFGSAPNRLIVTEKDGTTDSATISTVTIPGGRHTIQFYDGLGGLVETKRELADNLNGAGRHSVARRLYEDRDLLKDEYVAWETPAQTSTDFLTRFEAVESASPAQPFTTWNYDGAARVTATTHPDGSAATTTFGDPPSAGEGRTRTLTDQNGHQRTDYLDRFGRLARVDEDNGAGGVAPTRYAYNARDLLELVTDPTSTRTEIQYDGLGRKLQSVDPDSGTWRYQYDGLGRLATQTDAKDQVLTFTYDLASRLVTKEGQTSPTAAKTTLATYTYDQTGAAYGSGLGRRTSMADLSAATNGRLTTSATWRYDSRGRVTQEQQTILGTTYTTTHSYVSLDRPVTTTYPDAAAEGVTTGYGAHGLPVSLASSLAGQNAYVAGTTYSALFQPLGWTYGNGVVASLDYFDAADEPNHDGVAQPQDFRLRQLQYSLDSTLLQEHAYRYDRAGNVLAWWQQDHGGTLRTWSYAYDERDRLLTANVTNAPTGAPASFAYTHDATGNITSGPLGTYTYGDAAHKHAVTAAGANTYSYDTTGAVLQRTEAGTSYTHGYDLEGRQTSVTTGGTTTTFVSNGDGWLVAKKVGSTVVAHYAAGGRFEKNPSTGQTKKYYRFGGRLVAVRDSSSGLHDLHQDHLGSTSLQTSSTDAWAGHQFRGPFGQPWLAEGSLATDR
ncbi:MAG: hypothetical protein HY332_20185 [Chloroflexi bacterium]|nr:hypothetical protein [Chloroflexota bacterium]